MGPDALGQASAAERLDVSRAECSAAGGGRVGSRKSLQVIAVIPLVDDVFPGVGDFGGINPSLERHGGREMEQGRIGDGDQGVGSIEDQRVSELPGGRPGGIGEGAGIVIAGSVGHGGSRACVESVRGYQAGNGREGYCSRRGGVGAEVPGRIGGFHMIGVTGARQQAGVTVSSARHGEQPRIVTAAGSLAAFDEVAGDTHVVSRSGPAQIDLAAADCRGSEVGRHGRRLGIGSRCGAVAIFEKPLRLPAASVACTW